MKKKAMTWALIGTILGVLVLIGLVAITIRLLPSFSKDCTNKAYWETIKVGLKDVEDGKTSTVFFKNGNCYLVSFGSSQRNEISMPNGVSPQSTALCLCNIDSSDCIVTDSSKQCYFFNQINGFGMANQFNTEKTGKTYLFIKFEKQGNNLLITTK